MRSLFIRILQAFLYLVLDISCIFASVFLAYFTYDFLDIGKQVVYDPSFLTQLALVLSALVCSFMFLFGAYSRESGILNVKEIRSVILGISVSFLIVNAGFFVVRFLPSRYFVFFCFFYLILLLPLARSIVYFILTNRAPQKIIKKVLIYGAGELGQQLYREIHNSPRMDIHVVGFIDDDPDKKDLHISASGLHTDHNCRVMGDMEQLSFLVHVHEINEIYISATRISSEKFRKLQGLCRKLGVDIAFVPFMHEIYAHRLSMERVGNLPLIKEQQVVGSWKFDLAKKTMDLTLCAVLGIFLLPVMGIIALAIKKDSPGPVFFKQKRVGKDGRIFKIYKFRSMVKEAPKYAVNPNKSEDPRITRVGRFLRKTSLDELPQIINVLKGDMSLVGPRPEMPFIVEEYNEVHRERLKVLPGITGLWQLSGDRKKAIHENMDYDLYYIYNRSIFLDVTILFQTLIFAFKGI